MNSLTFGRKSLFVGSTRKETLRKDFCFSEFAHQRAESVFCGATKKQNRTLDLKIQTFSGLTTFGQDKKTNQLSDFKTKEKMLEIIDLRI